MKMMMKKVGENDSCGKNQIRKQIYANDQKQNDEWFFFMVQIKKKQICTKKLKTIGRCQLQKKTKKNQSCQ
ncbi:unnamed protein product [Paramecium pentaurelia]|uniref:Uncharacterized protein n=1 Tax=Paramecium pentaurelia TaxID=43138 RepID=A0A8S1YMX5_9CILI|nr:unnamed protein product [Paramecium pentaurelia]